MFRYVYIIFGVILIILLFKFGLGYHFNPTTKGLSGLINREKIEYLFVGSSQSRQALNPHILEDSLRSAYILAYNGNSFHFMNFLIEVIKNRGIQINNLIIEAYPYRAFQKTELSDVRMFNELKWREKFNFLQQSNDILTWRDKYNLLVLSGNESILCYPILKKFHNHLSYKGGYEGKVVEGLSIEKFSQLNPPFKDSTKYTGIDSLQIKAIDNIINFCAENKINLRIIEPPVPSSIKSSKIFNQAKSDLETLFSKKQSKFFDIDDYIFDNNNPSNFHDAVHLSSLGRDVYTKSICSLIINDK